MKKKQDNRGVTLLELIVVIAIMAVLGVVIAITVTQFIERAKHVQVENEAVQFAKAAEVAYVEAVASGNTPVKTIQHPVRNSVSPYCNNGVLYGRVTTFTFFNGITDTSQDNTYFNEAFFKMLKIEIKKKGTTWSSGSTQIPISDKSTLDTQKASMDDKCRFQAFYDRYGNMIVEYSRNGYFVRVEGSTIKNSDKAESNKDYFSLVKK